MTRLSPHFRSGVHRAQLSTMRQIRRILFGFGLALQLSSLMFGHAMADDISNFKTIAGISVYIGLIPAEIVKGHPSGHPEAKMHGGRPSGSHAYHLVVALFDEESGDRIENAEVTATVSGVGHVGLATTSLESMLIENTVTFGAFVDLRALERFDIGLTIKVPGRPEPVRVDFASEHLP